ncbi:nucleoside hydrolase [Gryllotalpicola ginsengisoli]|uniref:nucleoside hydrolase n=1 Tax=Gryllotalpicola ginsengisoli TaxID=444608 RepID=UPI0003B5C92C|nr:nucleoside hydrolase [Gryllotalpicola ginsengisoli]
MTPAARPVYLDCDTGIDDALAIAYLLASPEVRLVGVGTVSGNTSAAQAARNSLALLELAGHTEVPVAVGAHDPLAGGFDGGVPHIHGRNGIGDVELPEPTTRPVAGTAAELLLRLAHEHAGRLEVVTVGPLTNLALALDAEPGLPALVRSVTTMGGAALVPGNVSAVAEANIANDPEAALCVVGTRWDLTLVPLDVTLEHTLEESDRAALLQSQSPLAQALGRMLDLYFDFYLPFYGRRASALHDPLAAAIAVGGVHATRAPAVPITVDAGHGPGRGQTVVDLRGQRLATVDHEGVRTRVVLETDAPLAPHLIERITGAAAATG